MEKPYNPKRLTNFDIWKESLTPEDIVQNKSIILSCASCPAKGITCFKPDTTCRGNFILWANELPQEVLYEKN